MALRSLFGRFVIILAAASLAFGAYQQALHRGDRPSKRDAVTILQVGQGDCILLESNGRFALVDTARKNDQVDLTQRLVVPELLKRKVKTLEAVLLTHPDDDHIGGFDTLQRFFRIGKVVYAEHFAEDIQVRGVNRMLIQSSKVLQFGDLTLWVWAPPQELGEGDNAGSLVILVSGKSGGVLLTGDLPVEKEELLLSHIPHRRVDVLKAGHHGSGSSTGWGLLRTLKPKTVVFSCGRNNPFGHPNAEVVARCATLKIPTWTTAQSGSFEFVAGDP